MANPEHVDILRQGIEVWNQWRSNNRGKWLDLSGADFSNEELTDADLSGVDLTGADLGGANLSDATLNSAYLGRARFIGANLSSASLSDADLIGAELIGTNLDGTTLVHADLSTAKVGYLSLINTNLNGARGLETVTHVGPSEISISTIYRSQGNIPALFLRGCGVPEDFITYMHSLTVQPIQFYSCFISYSSKDQDFAECLHADLQNKGVRCWFAPEDLKIGDRFRDRINESIRLHDKLLLILSEHSVSSIWVNDEVEAAIEREYREKRTVLFPIKIDDAVMVSEQAWTATVRRTRHIGNFTGWKDHDSYQKAFNRLLRDLKAGEETRASGVTVGGAHTDVQLISEFEEIKANITLSTLAHVIAAELNRLKTLIHKHSFLLDRKDVNDFYASWIAPFEIHLEFGASLDIKQTQYEQMKEQLASIDLRFTTD